MERISQFAISRPRPNADFRLFCFPHAGGSPIAFFGWPEGLGSSIECVSLLYAGRGHRLREKPCERVSDLIEEIAGGIAPYSDKPFAFYGHSFGGIVAFELARKLRDAGRPEPLHLFVGAARPPHLGLPFSPIHHLPNSSFVAEVQARYGGIPAVILKDPEVLEMFLPAMRADFTAYETYRFQAAQPLPTPITAFGGSDDSAVKGHTLQEWSMHTQAGFDARILSGGHFFPAVSGAELLDEIRARIERDSVVSVACSSVGEMQ